MVSICFFGQRMGQAQQVPNALRQPVTPDFDVLAVGQLQALLDKRYETQVPAAQAGGIEFQGLNWLAFAQDLSNSIQLRRAGLAPVSGQMREQDARLLAFSRQLHWCPALSFLKSPF